MKTILLIMNRPSSDPFLAPGSASSRVQQLSPMAASFTPTSMTGSSPSHSQMQSPLSRHIPSIGRLPVASDSEAHGSFTGSAKSIDPKVQEFVLTENHQFTINGFPSNTPVEKASIERSRAFVIENVPSDLSYLTLAGFFNVSDPRNIIIFLTNRRQRREFSTIKGPVLTELASMGKVYVSFADIRDAKNAVEKVHMLRPEWRIFPLTARELVRHSDPSLLSKTSDFEGQLLVAVYYDSRDHGLNQTIVAHSLESLALTFGDVKSFNRLPTGQANIIEFHVEFFNTRDAENATTSLNGARVDVSSIVFLLLLCPPSNYSTSNAIHF